MAATEIIIPTSMISVSDKAKAENLVMRPAYTK